MRYRSGHRRSLNGRHNGWSTRKRDPCAPVIDHQEFHLGANIVPPPPQLIQDSTLTRVSKSAFSGSEIKMEVCALLSALGDHILRVGCRGPTHRVTPPHDGVLMRRQFLTELSLPMTYNYDTILVYCMQSLVY